MVGSYKRSNKYLDFLGSKQRLTKFCSMELLLFLFFRADFLPATNLCFSCLHLLFMSLAPIVRSQQFVCNNALHRVAHSSLCVLTSPFGSLTAVCMC
jgi:hypothetical protein